jgi:hypothetical protein
MFASVVRLLFVLTTAVRLYTLTCRILIIRLLFSGRCLREASPRHKSLPTLHARERHASSVDNKSFHVVVSARRGAPGFAVTTLDRGAA